MQSNLLTVVMSRCESWTIKKADCQRIDSFKVWYQRRLLRVAWTARRSNQSLLNKIDPNYSLERLMLKLKLQYFGHLMQRANSLEKTLMLGEIECKRGQRRQRMRWLDNITDLMDINLSKLWESEGWGSLVCYSSWGQKQLNTSQRLNNNCPLAAKSSKQLLNA